MTRVPELGNLFAGLETLLAGDLQTAPTEAERVDVLRDQDGVRIERIVSHGHASPPDFWYDQAEDEWVVLLSGAARLRFQADGREVSLGPGDYVFLPAHQKHRVEWTQEDALTVWLAVFVGQDERPAEA